MVKGKFLKVECPRCKKKYTIYNKPSMTVRCSKCNYIISRPSGGKARLRALVKKVLWR
ncbi:30S ribosomal protein S27e [Candidatus Pacearchaeota archaeon]|nr:30S ribosomal protein S27e [Candidatus Pacearchaeota archaeon]